MEIEQLEAFLLMLKDLNVKEYSHDNEGFHVEFFQSAPESTDDFIQHAPSKPLKNNFEHPALWPNGEPPKFPGK